jgi:hypothetical protein
MSLPLRKTRALLATAFLSAVLWTAPATAAPFTVTWDFGFSNPFEVPATTPFYDCSAGWGAGGLKCHWLWEQGLEISSATGVPMYGDGGPFYDAAGHDLPFESEIPLGAGAGLLKIVPECRAGLEPCFDTFTPLNISASVFFSNARGGVFFTSSRGGLVTAPNGVATFTGPEWTDIEWIYVGLYLADECGDILSDCRGFERGLDINRLTFDAVPIPEPASVLLLGPALLALVRRYRRRT